jgi:hypothetical protein
MVLWQGTMPMTYLCDLQYVSHDGPIRLLVLRRKDPGSAASGGHADGCIRGAPPVYRLRMGRAIDDVIVPELLR